MNYEGLERKRDAYETKIRKKAHDEFVRANRMRIVEYLDSLPYTQSIPFDQAILNLTQGQAVPDSLRALISLLSGQLEQRDKYNHIMRLLDEGMMYVLQNLLIARQELHLATALMVAMSGLHGKKTCRSFHNSGTIPYLVQLLHQCETDLELCSNILNVLGNMAVEEIDYRDALMKNEVHSWVINQTNRQLEVCSSIHTEDSDPLSKRFWLFCFWYLQSLGEHQECVFQPTDILQFVVKFIQPGFPPEIVQFCLAVLNDFHKYIEPVFEQFNQCLRSLVKELTTKEQVYAREVIHSVCYFNQLKFSDLQPFFYLMNPHHYTKDPPYVLTRKYRFMLCKVVLNNLRNSPTYPELQDEFFWNDLILQASFSSEITTVIKVLTNISLERGRDEWTFRFVSGSLSSNTELKELLAALQFLLVQLRAKEKEYVRMLIEKYSIDSSLESLQKQKNSIVYQKVEQILAFFGS